MVKNPWLEISLSDYEEHMRLASVRQLQALNRAMRQQLTQYPVTSAVILGVAGGNGLEHIDPAKYDRVYGVDVNPAYLAETEKRYAGLAGTLECVCLDLTAEPERLPRAELLIANLLIEYIGYDAFLQAAAAVGPEHISCLIQVNEDEDFVSDSPYLHAFDGMARVHHQIDEAGLTAALNGAGYGLTDREEYPLPNGKKLLRLDYAADRR